MSFLYVGEYPAISARIVMPLVGLWYVDADVDAPEVFSGFLNVDAPGLSLFGTVVTSTEDGGRVRVHIEPGAGRMAESIGPRFFRGATYRQVVEETLREVGEPLGGSGFDGTALAWSRTAGAPSRTVAAVASTLGLAWGATDEGLVTLFSPTWEEQTIETAELLSADDTTGLITLGTTDLSARPGRTIEGRRVTEVRHCISDVVRTELICEP